MDLDHIDIEEIENEFNTLSNAEGINELCKKISDILVDNEYAVESHLLDIAKQLNRYANINPELGRLNEMVNDLQDLTLSAEKLAGHIKDNLDTSEERLTELREQIDEIYRLQKKHSLSEPNELVSLRDELRMKTQGKENLDQIIKEKQKIVDQLYANLKKSAAELTKTRSSNAAMFSKSIAKNVADLAIPNAAVEILVQTDDQFTEYGADTIQLLFSANKGIPPQHVISAASGGELSRLALSVKSIIASKINVPTLLFDEIDTGISGNVALKLGHILQGISTDRQVITITHSPQVASLNGKHFSVSKIDKKDRTVTLVKELAHSDRIIEIAKMLSADPPSESALKNAQELIAMH
jgi:DNA repair protein RecN (Recombination protein N)